MPKKILRDRIGQLIHTGDYILFPDDSEIFNPKLFLGQVKRRYFDKGIVIVKALDKEMPVWISHVDTLKCSADNVVVIPERQAIITMLKN